MPVILVPTAIAFGFNAYGLIITIMGTQCKNPSNRNVLLAVFALGALVGNVLFTLLIATRIFMIAYQVMKYVPSRASIPMMYRTIISATLESGLVYAIGLIIYTICVFELSMGTKATFRVGLIADSVFDSLITIMGIASTLIIVRVTLGVAIHDEKSFKETIVKNLDVTVRNNNFCNSMDSHTIDRSTTESHNSVARDLETQKIA
ncbi:hypothetical protein PM082_024196 [Marasmius tenuissimus]|nr:hypothetical protein PM082_024196 [Marasmius tenuissimus]